MRIDELLARGSRSSRSSSSRPRPSRASAICTTRWPSCARSSPRSCRSPTARAARRGPRRSRSSSASRTTTAWRRWRTSPASAPPSTSCAPRSTRCARAGIDNVLALRGDPPAGQEDWVKTDGGLEYSRELVELIRADYPFAIGAACFPETHIHAVSPEADVAYLAEKVDAGVDFLITQLFFDNASTSTSSPARARRASRRRSSRASCRSPRSGSSSG